MNKHPQDQLTALAQSPDFTRLVRQCLSPTPRPPIKPNRIYAGHVLHTLGKMPDGSVSMVMTSPPYWSQRNYGFQLTAETQAACNSLCEEKLAELCTTAAFPGVEYWPRWATLKRKATEQQPKEIWVAGIDVVTIWSDDPACEHQWVAGSQKGVSGGQNSEKLQARHGVVNFQETADSPCATCVKCGAWKGALGHEPDVDDYVEHLCMVFDECWRVLADWGTLWVNLDDTYAGSGGSGGDYAAGGSREGQPTFKAKSWPARPKSLICIPARFQIAMVNRGWICRNEIIWHKNNPMPESCTDRFTNDFEKVYFFAKRGDYYFKQQFGPTAPATVNRAKYSRKVQNGKHASQTMVCCIDHNRGENIEATENYRGPNKKAMWSINTKGYKEAHFATYPLQLVATPIAAGCPPMVCPQCGLPKEYIITKSKESDLEWQQSCGGDSKGEYTGVAIKSYEGTNAQNASNVKRNVLKGMKKKEGYWQAQCECNAGWEPGIVLDPFFGAGTTGLQALKTGVRFVGCELNPDYIAIANKRLDKLKNNAKMDQWLLKKA